jgi:hypothetical protein
MTLKQFVGIFILLSLTLIGLHAIPDLLFSIITGR